jgi:hypothetical protein
MVALAMVALNLFHPGLCFNFKRFNRGKSTGDISDDIAMEEQK